MFSFYYFDPTMLIILPAIILAIWAQVRVKSTFKKYNKSPTKRGITGYYAARKILDENGLFNVSVEQIKGRLTDHYDPKANVIRLSEDVYNGSSCAAVGVAAHEAGHAVQYSVNYKPIKIRTAIIPATRFGSSAAFWLFLLGMIFDQIWWLMYVGIAFFALATIFQLVTLPIEFNASSRALKALEASQILYPDEIEKSKKVLSAAAMTYVAALAVSLLTLLRFILIANGRRR